MLETFIEGHIHRLIIFIDYFDDEIAGWALDFNTFGLFLYRWSARTTNRKARPNIAKTAASVWFRWYTLAVCVHIIIHFGILENGIVDTFKGDAIIWKLDSAGDIDWFMEIARQSIQKSIRTFLKCYKCDTKKYYRFHAYHTNFDDMQSKFAEFGRPIQVRECVVLSYQREFVFLYSKLIHLFQEPVNRIRISELKCASNMIRQPYLFTVFSHCTEQEYYYLCEKSKLLEVLKLSSQILSRFCQIVFFENYTHFYHSQNKRTINAQFRFVKN